jgi:hypothetical protein
MLHIPKNRLLAFMRKRAKLTAEEHEHLAICDECLRTIGAIGFENCERPALAAKVAGKGQ